MDIEGFKKLAAEIKQLENDERGLTPTEKLPQVTVEGWSVEDIIDNRNKINEIIDRLNLYISLNQGEE